MKKSIKVVSKYDRIILRKRINKILEAIDKLLFILIIILMTVMALSFLYTTSVFEKYKIDIDKQAQFGIPPGATPEQIQSILNEIVEEGMVNISINPNPVFKNGYSTGNLRIENIATNNYDFIVTLILNDTGEQLYQSDLIPIGYYVENINLERPLSKGEYNATAIFDAYIPKSGNKDSSISVDIVITILN